MNEKKLLIIENEIRHSYCLSEYFLQKQYHVDTAPNASAGLKIAAENNYDFLLISFELPDVDGLIACGTYRHSGGNAPVIIMTSSTELAVRIESYRSGADDVLNKPFDHNELHLRMRAIERRPRKSTGGMHKLEGIELDPVRKIARNNGRAVRLSEKECTLLNYLFCNANSVFSSAQLSSIFRNEGARAGEDTIRQRMRILRRKLSMIGAEELVKTIPNCGYILSTAKKPSIGPANIHPPLMNLTNNFLTAI